MKKDAVIHPVLIGMFPVLSLYSENYKMMPGSDLLIPVLAITACILAGWAALSRVMKDAKKAGMLVSLFVLLFFTCGQMQRLTGNLSMWGLDFKSGTYILLVWCAIFIIGSRAIIRLRATARVTAVLNLTAVFLVALPLTTSAYGHYSRDSADYRPEPLQAGQDHSEAMPDIYYIILDGYGRSDVLRDIYGYDNSYFLDGLRQRGFYVAEQSASNYAQTYLSLASSLNFTYLDGLADAVGENSQDRNPVSSMVKINSVSAFLKNKGYLFVSFSNGYEGTEPDNADIMLAPSLCLSNFQNLLLNTTPVPKLFNQVQYRLHANRLSYILEELACIPEGKKPVFVFAHILAPHPPFVFDENGVVPSHERVFAFSDGDHEEVNGDRRSYIEGYKKQVTYINGKIMELLDELAGKTARPRVVILQGDHGPGSGLYWDDSSRTDIRERMGILNAYLLPGDAGKRLYSTISPVNSFRLVFDEYFGAGLGLVDDKSYFSTWGRPYRFIDVTQTVNGDGASRM